MVKILKVMQIVFIYLFYLFPFVSVLFLFSFFFFPLLLILIKCTFSLPRIKIQTPHGAGGKSFPTVQNGIATTKLSDVIRGASAEHDKNEPLLVAFEELKPQL